MAAITSAQAGNWSSGSTWVGGLVPKSGDTASVIHNIRVDENTTVGDSPPEGVNALAVTVSQDANLTIDPGVTLTIKGGYRHGGDGDLTLQAGAVLEIDASEAAGGTNYRVTIGYESGDTASLICNGTSSQRCTIRSNASGGFGYIRSDAYRTGAVDANYTDFLRIGDDVNDAIYWYPGGGRTFRLRNCSFTTCGGVIDDLSYIGPTDLYVITNTTFTGTQADIALKANFYDTRTTGTWAITDCVFDKRVQLNVATESVLTFEGNLLEDRLYLLGQNSTASGCLVNHTNVGTQSYSDFSVIDSYILLNANLGSTPTVHLGAYVSTVGRRCELKRSVIEPVVSSYAAFMLSGSATTQFDHVCEDNVLVPKSDGTSGVSIGFAVVQNSAYTKSYLYNNTVHCRMVYHAGTNEGLIQTVYGNLVWDSSNNSGYKIYNYSPTTMDVVRPDRCNYNAGFNLRAGSNGKGYDGDIFSDPAPGANDLEGANPMFVDATRNIATWDAALGGPGTASNALAELRKRNDSDWDPNYSIAALVEWVRAGFVPTNEAYLTASWDGGTIGAMDGVEYSSSTSSSSSLSGLTTGTSVSTSSSSSTTTSQSVSTSSRSTSSVTMSESSTSSTSKSSSSSSSSTTGTESSSSTCSTSGSSHSASSSSTSSSTSSSSSTSTAAQESASSSSSSSSSSSLSSSSSSSSTESCSTSLSTASSQSVSSSSSSSTSVTESSTSTASSSSSSSSSRSSFSSSSSTCSTSTMSSSTQSGSVSTQSSSSSCGTDDAIGTRTLSASFKVSATTTIKNVLDDRTVVQAKIANTMADLKFATGIAANQATRAWQLKNDTITSGSTHDIDLYDLAGEDIGGGLGRDGLGQLITQKQVVAFVLKHVSGAGQLEAMPTNPANYATWFPPMLQSTGAALRAGGAVTICQPAAAAFAVTDASSHMIRLGAYGGDVTYSLYVLARHYGMSS